MGYIIRWERNRSWLQERYGFIITWIYTKKRPSFGIKINAVEGLTIAGGATSENSDTVTNSDPKGSTIGFSYKLGNFAIGYQEIENDIDAADSTPDSTEIEEGGIAYKVNDALTIGVYGASIAYIQDSANDNGVETDLAIVQIGYNLGPAVVQYDYKS